MMELFIDVNNVIGLDDYERARFHKLLEQFTSHKSKNSQKNRYYEGKIPLSEVNLGIALPKGMEGLEIGCSWGAKCVDVLAARSMFDGFVGENGEAVSELDTLVQGNNLIAEYAKAARDELKFGATFATLSADDEIGAKLADKWARRLPDAVVCTSDLVAAYVLNLLRKIGKQCPQDVLVTGVNDVLISTLVSPTLTTVHQPCRDIACTAFETLLWRFDNPDAEKRRIMLAAQLVVRESTAR